MDANNINIRKALVLVASFVVAVVILVWVYQFLTTGTITVTTNDANTNVMVSRAIEGDHNNSGAIKQSEGELTVRVKPGRYEVSAGNRTAVSSKTVVVKARQKVSIALSPTRTYASEPVLGQGVRSLVAGSDQLLFIDPDSQRLTRVNAQNKLDPVPNSPALLSAQWTSTATGVALSDNSKLFAVNNGVFNEIPLPFTPSSNRGSFGYALAPNGQLYVSNGADIYAGNLGGSFKKIYSAQFNYLRLAASNDRLAISYSGTEGLEGTAGGKKTPTTIALNSSGKTVGKEEGRGAHRLAWSPSGQYLLAQDNSEIRVYNNSFRRVKSVPVDTSIGIAWVNNNEFVYGLGNAVWRASIQGEESEKITRVGGSSVDEITVSSDGEYVYTVSPASEPDRSEVARIALTGQTIPRYLQTLGIFLPGNVGVCYLNYINFVSQTITVSYPSETTTADFCVNAARGELKYYGVEPDKFQYQPLPVAGE